MKKNLNRINLAMALLLSSAITGFAADLEPPVEGLRPATYDWTGPYVGVVGGGTHTGSHLGVEDCDNCGNYKREMNGWNWHGGVMTGYLYQMGSFVGGVEGSWQWGGRGARNRDPDERLKLRYKDMASARVRLGYAADDTLIYLTTGYAALRTKLSTDDYPTGSGTSAHDRKWVNGWVIGGGMEHAFTDAVSARLEYTYTDLQNKKYKFSNDYMSTKFKHHYKNMHTMSVGLAYHFGTW